MSKRNSRTPSRKWLATQCTALATLAVSWVDAGAWTKPLSIAAIGLVSQAAAGYLISNGEQPADAPAQGTGLATATTAG
jgi:hypothetical protein